MADFLSDALDALAADLSAAGAGQVHKFVPENYTPPCAAIFLGNPAVTDGDTFGTVKVGFEVAWMPNIGTNETITAELVKMIPGIYSYLVAAGWNVPQVGQPYMLASSGAQYLAVTFTVNADVPLITEN